MNPPSSDTLETLRDDLDAIDGELMSLVARRQEVVGRVAAAKSRESRPLFDRGREREVHERARRRAAGLGLDASLAVDLMQVLVEASHRTQESVSRATEIRDVLVVGGAGGMGRLFGERLARRGHRIRILEKDDGQDRAAMIRRSEIILVSVDMGSATDVVREACRAAGPESLVWDVNSLKSEVCTALDEAPGEALGTHPMFGPSVRTLRRQKMVVCPVRGGSRTDWLLAELGDWGLDLVETDPVTHDRTMAVIQVMLHFKTIVMGRALSRTGLDIRESLEFTSPIYRLEMALVGRLFAQRPDLYGTILTANPHGQEMRELFLETARDLEGILAAGDSDGFRLRFEEAARYFEDFSEVAMTESGRLIETLMRMP